MKTVNRYGIDGRETSIDFVYMKKKYFGAAVLAAVSCALVLSCSGSKGIVNVTPENSLDWMSVYRVVLEDTATVVQGNLYGMEGESVTIPPDIRLRGTDTGTEYSLLYNDSGVTGTPVVMPADMTMPFSLVFEAVDRKDKYVDMLCGNETIRKIPLCREKAAYSTTIKGTLEGRPHTSRLILSPANSDVRINPYISVPVIDGKFCYELHTDVVTAYELSCWDDMMTGGWYNAMVFSDGGTVELIMYPIDREPHMEYGDNTSGLTLEYKEYTDAVTAVFHDRDSVIHALWDSLYENKSMFTDEFDRLVDSAWKSGYPQDLVRRMEAMQTSGEAYTDEGRIFKALSDSLSNAKREYMLGYCRSNPGLVSYYLVFDRYCYDLDTVFRKEYRDIVETTYAHRYPDHPFTLEMRNLLISGNIRPGGRFVDFSAPDLSGRMHSLSDEIAGKNAVIDLWASWCGPCRRHSRDLIPVYEQFKDKGFTVVGIARERMNTAAMEKAVSDDGYPWLNLVELDDAGRIWQKYGAGNGGGMTVLVDRTGTIVAVNPAASEVREYLEREYALSSKSEERL